MSDTGLVIRRCSSFDWEELKSIRLESLRDTPEAYGSTYEDAAMWPDDRWRSAASQWTYWLAERHGHVVGMVSGGTNDHHRGTRWMYGMYVTPAERGSDVATRLVEEVSLWARSEGAASLFLHVTSTVARARAFYEKVGFVLTGDVIDMDRDPSLQLVTMVRELG